MGKIQFDRFEITFNFDLFIEKANRELHNNGEIQSTPLMKISSDIHTHFIRYK